MENVYNIGFYIGETPCVLVGVNPDNRSFRKTAAYYDHCHHYLEIHYVQQGSCSFLCEQALVPVEEQEILLIPPQMYHKEAAVSGGHRKMSISVMLSAPAGGTDTAFWDCLTGIRQPRCIRPTPQMVQLLGYIQAQAQTDDSDRIVREKLKIACNAFLLALLEQLSQGQPLDPPDTFSLVPSREYVINNFFAKHYMSNAAKEELAQMLHISVRQLHRVMQKIYGTNYRQQLTQIRLKIAVGFLNGTEKSIAEISELMGYSSPANFSTFVKKATGKTPGQIRKHGYDRSHHNERISEQNPEHNII